ncbi:MAG TPA: hypothetical protein VHY84_06290 [Bryobacteraceae bacterium]|jgi:dihydroorotase|nr:hypothetical protein [Bryobacteraceae bacterium]
MAPGLIDIHVHARDVTLLPPEILPTGVTTVVDAGSRGADNLDQILKIARTAPNRMRISAQYQPTGQQPESGSPRRISGWR